MQLHSLNNTYPHWLLQTTDVSKLLTLGVHAQERFTLVVLCVSICVSVATLSSTWYIYTLKVRYQWILHKLLKSLLKHMLFALQYMLHPSLVSLALYGNGRQHQ